MSLYAVNAAISNERLKFLSFPPIIALIGRGEEPRALPQE
jgi:hypothetical protein